MRINKKLKKISAVLLSVLFWIAVWQIAATKINLSLIIPTPVQTLSTFLAILKSDGFLNICAMSVVRIFLGAVIGIILGALLAATAHFITTIKHLIFPLMSVIKATPVASFIVLLLILTGKEVVPTVTAALIALPIIYSNVSQAIESIDKSLSEVCTVFSFSFIKRLKVLWLPSIMPSFIAGMKSCIGLSWKAGIAAEVLCTPVQSIGYKINETRIYLETPELFAWTAVVIILSFAIEKLTLLIFTERRRK